MPNARRRVLEVPFLTCTEKSILVSRLNYVIHKDMLNTFRKHSYIHGRCANEMQNAMFASPQSTVIYCLVICT